MQKQDIAAISIDAPMLFYRILWLLLRLTNSESYFIFTAANSNPDLNPSVGTLVLLIIYRVGDATRNSKVGFTQYNYTLYLLCNTPNIHVKEILFAFHDYFVSIFIWCDILIIKHY